MAGFERSGSALVRWRWPVLGGWLLVTGALLPLAGTIEHRLTAAARVEGSESAALEEALRARFGSPFAQWLVLVLAGVPAPVTPEGRAVLGTAVEAVDAHPHVARTFSYLDEPDSLFLGAHRTGTFIVVGLRESERPERLLPALRELSTRLERELRARHAGATARWTGEVALNADLREASASAAQGAERRALPLTLVVLLLAFGALVAALLPLLAAAVSVGVTLGVVAVLAAWWPLSIVLQNVVSMLGIGLAIDYALLMISRYRTARALGRSVRHSAVECVTRAGPTVLLSAGTVAIGFGALLLVPLNELRAIAVGGLVVTTVSALVAITLIPAALAITGSRLELGRLPSWSTARSGSWWRSWARQAVARPRLVLALGAAPLCALAWQATRLDTRLPRGDWLPREMESAHAVRDLQRMERGNIVQGIRIVLELPPGMRVLDHAGWRAVSRATATLLQAPEVARVRSLPTTAPGALPGPLLESLLPPDVKATFVSRDGRATLLEVVPSNDATPNALVDLVTHLRARGAVELAGTPGTRMLIGGIPAFNADYRDALTGRFATVASVVIVATLLVLGVALRSALIPLKAVALNLLSVTAAFGAMVLVFGDGFGVQMLGHAAAPGGTFPMIPVLVFCIVFGLSMDYELFLVSRVMEARRGGASESEAIVEGVARTGAVITSAAAIMIVVFGAFMLGDVLLVQMLGFALAVAVLIDATVVRMAIGPALLQLAGRWNWWPGVARSRASWRDEPGAPPHALPVERVVRPPRPAPARAGRP